MIIGPGSFYTSLMPIFLVRGVAEALAQMKGPIILIANLLTEGRGMIGFTAADAVARIEEASGRQVDVVITNMKWPSPQVLGRYAQEHKEPLAPGHAAGALRAGGRRVLDQRHRAARSAAARLRGLDGALAAPAGGRRRTQCCKTAEKLAEKPSPVFFGTSRFAVLPRT